MVLWLQFDACGKIQMCFCSRYISNSGFRGPVTVGQFQSVPLHDILGMAPVAAGPLNGGNTTATSVMLDRAENLLHKNFGQYQFWSARRSMRFSPELRKFANEYREEHFNSGEKSKIFKVSHVTLF